MLNKPVTLNNDLNTAYLNTGHYENSSAILRKNAGKAEITYDVNSSLEVNTEKKQSLLDKVLNFFCSPCVIKPGNGQKPQNGSSLNIDKKIPNIKRNSLSELDKSLMKNNKGKYENQDLKFKKDLFDFMSKHGSRMPYSEHPRQYPPVSMCDSVLRVNTEFPDQIVTDLTKLYKNHGLNIKVPEEWHNWGNQEKIEYLLKNSGLVDLENFSLDGAHGYGLSYADKYILHVHKDINNAILQKATRGCTAAVSAMLIADHGGKIMSEGQMATRNLGDTEAILHDLKTHEIEPMCSNPQNLTTLKNALEQNGPGIVSVNSGVGGHVVIVDKVNPETQSVTIRDPAHGWRIDVAEKEFLKSWHKDEPLIQGNYNKDMATNVSPTNSPNFDMFDL
ncbi:papain-like cysteine protease family protein [Aeromonas jandaei]|uniref:papain-like cysteine protease family protein n=1 Tax=Aeromonas jandaei TaxID=650 RepID=UPI003BA27B31